MKKRALYFVFVLSMLLCCASYGQDDNWASSIAWSPDGQTIAVGGGAGVWFFDNAFNELGFARVEHPTDRAPRIAWNATGEFLVYSSFLSSIKVVEVNKREVIREIELPDPGIWAPVHWHPKENQILGGTYLETAYIWDAITGEELFYFESPANPIYRGNWYLLGFCWHAENEFVIVTRRATHIVAVTENEISQSFSGYLGSDWISCNRDYKILTPDGWLLDLATDKMTKIFELGENLQGTADIFPFTVSWSPSADQFVLSLNRCRIRVYEFDGQSARLAAELAGGSYYIPGVGFRLGSIGWHPDSSRFAVVGEFGDIRVWDANTHELLHRFDGFELHPDLVRHLQNEGVSAETICP